MRLYLGWLRRLEASVWSSGSGGHWSAGFHCIQHNNNDSVAIDNISVSLLPLHNAAWVTAAGV